MTIHDHTYEHMLQIIQRPVAVQHVHAIVVVQASHPPLLVTITIVNQEIQVPGPFPAFSILVILFGMASSAVQRVPAAVMDEPLHGLVWRSIICGDFMTDDEDTPIELLEIYIQWEEKNKNYIYERTKIYYKINFAYSCIK